MNFFYLDKKIEDPGLKKFSGQSKFSKLSIQKSSLTKIIKSSLDSRFIFKEINSIQEIKTDNIELIIWSSNMIYLEEELQKLFLQKLIKSYFSILYGSQQDFIFKGYIGELNTILKPDNELVSFKEVVKLESEENILTINTIWDLKKFAMHKPHTRHFNKIEVEDRCVIKESKNKEKIISEFSFLNNIPKEIKKYYVSVSDLKVKESVAQYSMSKIDGMDLSMQFINKGFSNVEISNILNELKIYFEVILKFKGSPKETLFNFLVQKNNSRLLELKTWNGFKNLDTFISNHTPFLNINKLFDVAYKYLNNNKPELNKSQSALSHGDLCFSNIIKDNEQLRLLFIDPRGGEISDCYRSPYYDLAKLCHSLLGGYDHIINNVAEIVFDEHMYARVRFHNNLVQHEESFKVFVESLGFNYKLVRIIEISLFLSMLPLHVDSTKKINLLALRASELILDIENY